MNSVDGKQLTILIISGATGHTAGEVVNAALAQFDNPLVRIVTRNNVRTKAALRRALNEITTDHLVICHSLISPSLRDELLSQSQKRMIPTVDVLGRVVALFGDQLGIEPRLKAGRSYRLNKERFDRMDAVSFTLEHDDGARVADLKKADVVLVGVSRASKSVTCFYLGYRGIRAANVPLVYGCDIPGALAKMPKHKVIGLTINANRLQKLREARNEMLGTGPLENYVDRQHVARELHYATEVCDRYGWRRIDVSYMAVEEIARKVLEMIHR